MPVINRNTPVENIQVPVPTPVQTKPKSQGTPPAVQQVQRPRPIQHPPISFGGENDEFGRPTHQLSAVIMPWVPNKAKQLSRKNPKRYSGETTEDDFHRMLDENPDDHQTRLIFADWLQERNDPRAEGYRALAVNRRIPVSSNAAGYRKEGHEINVRQHTDHGPYIPNKYSYWLENQHELPESPIHRNNDPSRLPEDWIENIPHSPEFNVLERVRRYPTRREVEDQAAHAFNQLLPERKHELLNPKQLSRKRIQVITYKRPNLTPAQKDRAKKVELVVLPTGIEGKKCGTCKYGKHHKADKSSNNLYCFNNQVHMNVKSNWGCKLWDQKGVKRLSKKSIMVKRYQRPVPERGKLTPEEANLLRQHIDTGELVPLGMLGDSLAERGYPHTGALISRHASQIDPHRTNSQLIGEYHPAYQQAPILRPHDFHYVPGEGHNLHDVHIGVPIEEPSYSDGATSHQFRIIGTDNS